LSVARIQLVLLHYTIASHFFFFHFKSVISIFARAYVAFLRIIDIAAQGIDIAALLDWSPIRTNPGQ
jgi:hypothetical protein